MVDINLNLEYELIISFICSQHEGHHQKPRVTLTSSGLEQIHKFPIFSKKFMLIGLNVFFILSLFSSMYFKTERVILSHL